MIAIINESGETLQLDPEQHLVTEQATAWLSDEELPGEFSYPIEAPLNETNKRFVQHAYRPDGAFPRYQMIVFVQMEGVLYRRCTFSYRLSEGKLSGYLKIDSSEFYDKIRKMSLLDALPDVVPLGDGFLTNPPLTVQARLKQIVQLGPGQFPCTFFPIRNQIFFEEDFDSAKLEGFARQDYVNAWQKLPDGSFGFPMDLTDPAKFGFPLCPQFYLWWVLERIMALAGYRIESDWLASEEVQRITIKNLTALNMQVASFGDGLTGHKLVAGLFLPDMSVSDFLIAVKSRFSLIFSYNANQKVCRITQFAGAISAPAAVDLTPFQTGRYSTDFPDGKGFTLTEFIDSGDELYKDSTGQPSAPASETVGLGQTTIPLKAGTCQQVYQPSGLSEGAFWLVPSVRQAGNTLDAYYKKSSRYLTQEGKRPNSVGLCFLSYRGMTTDSKGNPYPLGTPDVRSGQQQVIGSQGLGLSGRYGAFRQYLRAYYYFRDLTQKVTQPLLLPVGVLSTLRLDGKVQLSLDDQIRRSYLISKLQAEAPGVDGKVYCRLEVLTLPAGLTLSDASDSPVVWVDLVLGDKRAQSLPLVVDAVGTYPLFLQSVTIRCWSDQARSLPLAVSGLTVNLRQYMKGFNTTPTQEYVTSYLVNGISTTIEADFVATQNVYSQGPTRIDEFTRTIQLDPGDGYSIIP